MEGLKNINGQGLFQMEAEKVEHYKEMIYTICKAAVDELMYELQHPDVFSAFINNLNEVKEHFNSVEDYEMSYLIEYARQRILKEYEQEN